MKTFRKCKKQIANNAKKCKYCGSNVTTLKLKDHQKDVKDSKSNTKLKNNNSYQKMMARKNNKPIVKEEKQVKKEEKKTVKSKISTKSYKSLKETPEQLFSKSEKINRKEKTAVNRIIKNKRKRLVKKVLFFISMIFIILLLLGYFAMHFYKLLNLHNTIREDDPNQRTVFEQGEKITYKKVNYRVLKVETSAGTNYKKPKEGNHFLVVTLEIENTSQEKVKYSYKNWRVLDSQGQESERVITPINAGHALYSGELVIGGSKTASLVFEEPIDDKKLQLRFYEEEDLIKYKEEIESQEQIEDETQKVEVKKPDPIFAINLKVK